MRVSDVSTQIPAATVAVRSSSSTIPMMRSTRRTRRGFFRGRAGATGGGTTRVEGAGAGLRDGGGA